MKSYVTYYENDDERDTVTPPATVNVTRCHHCCDGFTCTRPEGHGGAHVAHGERGQRMTSWNDERRVTFYVVDTL